MRYFSCDSHVVEAAEIYDGLTDKFGDRAPFIEKDYQGCLLYTSAAAADLL